MSTSHPFEIPGSGGLPIRGDLHLPGGAGRAPVVVAVHGFKGFRRWGFWPAMAERFCGAGIAFLNYDATHNGVGPGGLEFDEEDLFERNTWGREEEDLGAVLDALRGGSLPGSAAVDTARLGLLGHSRGGGLVVVRAAADPAVRTVACLAPVACLHRLPAEVLEEGLRRGFVPVVNTRTGQVLRLGRDALAEIGSRPDLADIPSAHASRIRVPLLVCHGEEDPAVPVSEGRRIAEAAPQGVFEPMPGGDHVLGCRHPWAGSNPLFDRFLDLATGWFGRHLEP